MALHVDQWSAACDSRSFPNWPMDTSVIHYTKITDILTLF